MRWVAKVSNCTPCAGVEARQRVGQADHADLDQVVDLDVGRQLGDHLVREAAHQRAVLLQRRVEVELAFGGVHGCRTPGYRSGLVEGLVRCGEAVAARARARRMSIASAAAAEPPAARRCSRSRDPAAQRRR